METRTLNAFTPMILVTNIKHYHTIKLEPDSSHITCLLMLKVKERKYAERA